MIEIVELKKEYVIVYKPAGVPSQSDKSGDKDAMLLCAEALAARGEGTLLWLVHRLDRTVGGLLVFARTKSAAAELSRLVADGGIEKRYLAVAEGVPENGIYTDYIYKDASAAKAFISSSPRRAAKEARLVASLLSSLKTDGGERALVEIELLTGRFHQIRAQLSHRHTPLVGDGKYGGRDKGARTPALFAYHLAFSISGKRVEARRLPDTETYPWSLFEEQIKELDK